MDLPHRGDLRATARAALGGTLLYAAVRFAGAYLDQYAVAAAVVQAVVAEYGAGRMGIAWSDPLKPLPRTGEIARRAVRGAGMGLTAAILVLGIALATKAAWLAPNRPDATVALVNLVPPLALAARDELLLRGVVLRVLPNPTPAWLKLATCGLASAAAAFGEGLTVPTALTAAAVGGVAYGALWLYDRGAWLAWGAHAGFLWASGTLARGALLDVRMSGASPSAVASGTTDPWLAGSWATVLALGMVCAGALLLARGAISAART